MAAVLPPNSAVQHCTLVPTKNAPEKKVKSDLLGMRLASGQESGNRDLKIQGASENVFLLKQQINKKHKMAPCKRFFPSFPPRIFFPWNYLGDCSLGLVRHQRWLLHAMARRRRRWSAYPVSPLPPPSSSQSNVSQTTCAFAVCTWRWKK